MISTTTCLIICDEGRKSLIPLTSGGEAGSPRQHEVRRGRTDLAFDHRQAPPPTGFHVMKRFMLVSDALVKKLSGLSLLCRHPK